MNLGPHRYAVARDAAEERGDDEAMRAAERGAELWHRPPEEWELDRQVWPDPKLWRLAHHAHFLVGVPPRDGAMHAVVRFLDSIPRPNPVTATQGAAFLATYMMLPGAEIAQRHASEERRRHWIRREQTA